MVTKGGASSLKSWNAGIRGSRGTRFESPHGKKLGSRLSSEKEHGGELNLGGVTNTDHLKLTANQLIVPHSDLLDVSARTQISRRSTGKFTIPY